MNGKEDGKRTFLQTNRPAAAATINSMFRDYGEDGMQTLIAIHRRIEMIVILML